MNHGIGQVPQVYSLTILGSTNAILSLAEIPQYISSGNISTNAAIAIFQLRVGHCTLRSTNTCTGSGKQVSLMSYGTQMNTLVPRVLPLVPPSICGTATIRVLADEIVPDPSTRSSHPQAPTRCAH